MDVFKSHALTAGGTAADILPVTPNDTTDLLFVTSALYVEQSGTLSVVMFRNQTRTLVDGDLVQLPLGGRRVRTKGTAPTGNHA